MEETARHYVIMAWASPFLVSVSGFAQQILLGLGVVELPVCLGGVLTARTDSSFGRLQGSLV